MPLKIKRKGFYNKKLTLSVRWLFLKRLLIHYQLFCSKRYTYLNRNSLTQQLLLTKIINSITLVLLWGNLLLQLLFNFASNCLNFTSPISQLQIPQGTWHCNCYHDRCKDSSSYKNHGLAYLCLELIHLFWHCFPQY